MKVNLLILVMLFFFSVQQVCSQEGDGVVSFDLPIRNSLMFNRYAINPTFSFVREQNKYISFNTKREWVQFDNAPETLLASYSGRFAENIGAGIAAFQQNYGVLTTFGGLLNFAYNVKFKQDSNLTFGLNVGAYKSGINTSNIVVNFDDPSLQNVQENFLLTINPGINYGTKLLDFGISINNLVLYNIETSEMLEDDPKQGIQAHIMHTGYFDGRGFFEDTKFSGILMSEFRQDQTIISGIASMMVPRGIWFQLGYNNLYGVSGGLGLNITKNIAIEYNVEKAIGEMVDFGPSHEISLAYRIIPRKRLDYTGDEEVSGLFKKAKKKPIVKASEEELAGIRERAAERRAKTKEEREAELLAKKQSEENAIAEARAKAEQEAQEKAKRLEEERARQEAEAQAKALAEQKAKEEAEELAKTQAKERARLLAEQKAKQEADAKAKALAEQQAKERAEAKAKALAEQKAKEEAEAKAKAIAEQKAKEEEARLAQLQAEKEAQAKALAEQKVREEAEAKALAEQQALENARLLEEQKAKQEAEARAKELAEQKAKQEADAKAKALAEQQAKEEAEAKALSEQQEKEALLNNPKDALGKSLVALAKDADSTSAAQKELLKQYDDIIEIKNNDLKDLKEENDLSEQGITVQPRPFKSVTAENNKLNAIKANLDNIIEERNKQIDELKSLYDQRTRIKETELDEVALYYDKKIKRLTQEQLKSVQTKQDLEAKLETIRVATEFEKRRRIKRAAYDNEQDRYTQDRNILENLKRTTQLVDTPYKSEDFDFGEEQSANIQILKNVKNTESGYYLIIAVHSDINKRNEFLKKVIASGRRDVDFFYDVKTSKYYIYYNKFDDIGQANKAMSEKGNRPYNINMTLVKIE